MVTRRGQGRYLGIHSARLVRVGAGANERPPWDFLGFFTNLNKEPEDKAKDAVQKLGDAGAEAKNDTEEALQRPLSQAQDAWQNRKADASSKLDNAQDELQEWGDDTPSKADPLGYFMMGLVLLGLLGVTTTLFKAAGAWRSGQGKETPPRQDRQAVSEPESRQDHAASGLTAEQQEQAAADDAIRSLPEAGADSQMFNKGELEGMRDMGDEHLARLGDLPREELPAHSLEHMLEQQPEEQEQGHRVYLPGQGWTTISEEEGYRAISAPGQALERAQQQSQGPEQKPQPAASEQADTAMREQQPQQGSKSQAPEQASKDGQEATASGTQSQEQRPALAAGAVAASSTGQQEGGQSSERQPGPQGPQQGAQSSEQAPLEDEDDEDRDFHRWQQYRPAEAAAVKLTDKELPEHRVDPEKLHIQTGSSTAALRQRADLAGQAAVAASEASQRAASHATNAASAATQASLNAERAHAAASRARSVAAEGFTRSVEISERKAHAATEAARQAEQRAASSSGHSAAFQNVGAAQADASEKAASAQAAQSSQGQQSGIQAVRSKVQGTAHRAWATGTTRLSRLGNALHLDRLSLGELNFGKAWRAVFQFLSDMWERLRAVLLSAWHWVQESGQKLGGKLRASAQHKAQAT